MMRTGPADHLPARRQTNWWPAWQRQDLIVGQGVTEEMPPFATPSTAPPDARVPVAHDRAVQEPHDFSGDTSRGRGDALASDDADALIVGFDVVRLPPSHPLGALASLAEAFGGGGKPDTTYFFDVVRLPP